MDPKWLTIAKEAEEKKQIELRFIQHGINCRPHINENIFLAKNKNIPLTPSSVHMDIKSSPRYTQSKIIIFNIHCIRKEFHRERSLDAT